MKVVDHVRIGIPLEKEHLVKSGPAMTGRDDRMVRRAGTDCGDQFSLYAVPAIAVFNHRLVYHFEKHELRIPLRQVARESTPEFCKSLDATLVAIHSQLKLVAWM